MALQKPNSRRLLNKDEEDEKKRQTGLMLPTFEELVAIEEKAKEDAAAAVSSQMADPMRNRNDLGRVAMQDAKREMLAEHENAVNEQKQKVERAKQEYEAYPLIDRVGIGSSSLMADIARDNIKKQENEYDRMTMTEPEYAKKHKADFGESVEQIVQSAGYGAAKSFGQAADVISATGAGLKSAGKWLGGEGDDESSAAKEFARGFQNRLADTEKSLYDEIDAEYQRERQRNAKVNGELNMFAGYVDQAAHSVGEQALMYWTASMSSALFGGAKVFSAISSKADDLAKSGKKGMQMLGQALGKINAGSVGGAASMLVTSSAQSTKEAIFDMRQQNEAAAAYGMPKKYTDDEIMEKSALYGFLNGLSEVGLEYAIGGITGAAGGILPKGKVKNPFLTAVLSYLKGSAGEGFEEPVQTLASTGLKRAVYDQTAEVDWREVLDSGIVGMLTGFGMGAPSFIRNTSIGVSAMRDVSNTAKATNRVNTDAQAGVVASASAAKAKAYGQMAEQVRSTDSENADTVASIYEWAAGRQQEIADAMADDTKRKQIIEENAKKSAEHTQAAIQRMRDTDPDFAETERTGLASGAKAEDIRMAGEISSVLGKKIRFFSEDAKNGTINNGEYHEDTGEIWINARSRNVKAQIVAHELTHSIEKKDSYQKLVDLTMNKLEEEQKAKGKTLDDLYREKETLYADGGVRLASYDEITSELVAEFVEKRLLTDEASIKSLVSENRTLGQRIREWFDSLLVKMGNASAKEREYIRQMRDMYARALGEDVSADGKNVIKHDIAVTDDGKMYVTASRNVITGKTQDEQSAQITQFFKELLRNEPSLDITTVEGDVLTLTMDQTEYKARDDEKQVNNKKVPLSPDEFKLKLRVESHIDEIAETSTTKNNTPTKDVKNHPFAKDGFTYRRAYFKDFDGKYYEITFSVGHDGDTATVYNVGKIKESTMPSANLIAVVGSQPLSTMLSDNSISQNGGNVKGQNAGNGQHSISAADDEAVRKNTPGVKDAEETAQINEEIERVDLNYDSESGTVYHSFSSLEDAFDYNKGEEEYRAARNEYAYALAKATGKTYAQAQQYLDDLFLIHDLIGDDRDRLDYVAAVDRSSWVGNVEYGGSIDFSTLCAKRRLFTGTFDAIQQALPDTVLNENDFLRIRELLVEKGLESPCSMCYVEGSRAKHGVYVERFLRDYLETDPEWRPQIADFTSTTRLEQTRIQHPEAYKAYTDAMNKLSQRKPKEASVRTDYKGEILRAFKNDDNVNAKNLMGGIRFNSFSDFEIIHAIDVMQVLTDMARVGLHGQSYTKQKEFAEAFGNTGLKINLSLVAKDVDADGRLIFDEVNGMKEAEAMDIRGRYSENVGTVIVVFNEAQLRAALADERIDFVLPFHRSQWKKSQYTMMGLPAETRDFTNIQNDRMKNPKTGRAKKVDGGNIMPNQYWDPSLDGRGNAQLYLDYINENDYIPKFDFLLTKQDGKWVLPEGAVGDGYFKLLIDFKMYDNDGNGAPQRPVTPDFNMPYITKMLEDYKGGHGSFPVANDIVDTFVREKQGGRVKHSVSREDASVTEAETDQTLQQIRNDIAADEARYRELSDAVMSNERFNAMMPDEQNAILDEMQSLRERIDRANQIVQDMSIEQDMGDDVPVPTDGDVPAENDGYHGMKSMRDAGDDIPMPGDEYAPPQRRPAQAEFGEPEAVEVDAEEEPKLTRKVLHKNIMDRIKERFAERGFDFDKVLAKAKDLSTFATVDNTPQRVMEKSLGYKEGRELSDLTIDQAAKNETEAIRWLNGFTDKKDGVLAKLSKKYNIKPGSKESAAAQMYAEGFYVSDKNEIVEYGDRELAADFPDAQVRENIKGLAHDPIIRQIYDETLDAINASRTRNAFPEIQKLDNYYLHFRAMDDTFSRLGIPFNPNDIRAKDLPTDLNGVTADLKPGQPYFASANHRLGKRTSFDLLGGMEKYLTSAKNQIYHIDDIQTLRALRNYVADMYGQAEGLANLDDLSDEEVEARIKDIYGSHLSTFAKFLNEEANVLAGKTSLIDRGLEGVIGRRGITFLNDVNRQVGANMVGYNISSSLTNFLAPVQAFAKMNKAAFVKGFAQTVENRMKSITGNGDDFAQKSDVIVRRKGADRFHRTAWQKMSDPGYLLMGMVDDISTEIIARAKYNELTAKGMDAETANRETDKWVSRLMGDRSLGQMPQIFNSKMLGLVTKFQLEVRNQLDSQFYDTIKEAQVQYEEIGDKAKRNAKTAAKVAATFAELALAQHVFGSVFESIAGYNPAFDIIEVIATVLGLDDDEESEDTALDNIEQGVLALIEDLPYSSVIMDGGRIPVSSAMPIGEIVKGQDEYGNGDDRFGGALQRLKTVAEAVPYYALPGGYGQIKKTAKGLSMFSGDKAVTGSYTDSGNLRFPVEATPGNIAQAAVFGQWANENARDYFDNERKPANERQTMGYAESGLEWKEFQKYRDQISKLDRDADKLALIKSLDIDQTAKEALYRYLVASAKKDDDGNIIGSSEDERLAALYATGLRFSDYADAKLKQAELNADTGLTANQRATRFYAWAASEGYTDEQADAITEQFKFSSGFKVEPTQYKKLIGGGVSPENAVLVTDALSGASRAIDKINAVWSTGLTGKQLDNAVKAVVTEGWYERYRKVVDANVPLDVLTWVLDNADANGNDSIDNEERTLILSQLAMSRKELSALWEATGGSEKSNPYSGTSSGGVPKVSVPKVEVPKIEMPKIELPKIGG